VGLPRWQVFALIALVAYSVLPGPAVGAAFQREPGSRPVSGPVTHPDRDYAGSGLMERHFGAVPLVRPAGLPGLDVSSWQGNVDWATVAANGARFAYVKATDSTT